MRTPAQAARDALDGSDETLWQACYEIARDMDMNGISTGNGRVTFEVCERAIRSMTSAERSLYDISEE